MKLITKIYLAIGFILLFFSIVTLTYLFQTKQVERDIRNVLISTELLRESELMQKSMLDMESGFRGYLIAENESFLAPYYTGQKESNHHYQKALSLVNNEIEKKYLQEIKQNSNKWVTTFADVVIAAKRNALKDKRNARTFDSLNIHTVKAGYGKAIMDQTRTTFYSLDSLNNSIKNNQVQALNKSLSFTRNISTLLTILAIIIGIITAFLLGRTIHRRLNKMIGLADQISKGNFEKQVDDAEKDEMSQLSASLNIMSAKLNTYFTGLTKTNKELDQFAYVVSHDLKAPLRAINNLAEWISEDLPNAEPEIKKNLQLMRGRAQRMENLINGILEYSKVGRKEVPVETFDVSRLLEDIIDSLAPPENYKIELPETGPVITTEKIFMQQVFTNLISNGIKYGNKPNGLIRISYADAGDFFEFRVFDNGPGIPEQYHERIFGIFQTMEARDTRESTGVGLAIVKKIIDEKGGKIMVRSAEDEFTEFVFTWPKHGNRRF